MTSAVRYQPADLNIYYTQNLSEKKDSLAQKSQLYDVLSKITLVALVALCAGVFAASMVSGVLAPSMPLLFFFLILGSPALMGLADHLQAKSISFQEQKQREEQIEKKQTEMNQWTPEELTAYADQQKLQIPPSVLEGFATASGECSLKPLIPVLARYNVSIERARELIAHANQYLDSNLQNQLSQRVITRIGREKQQEAMQNFLQAALLRQILYQPTLKADSYSDLGTLFRMTDEKDQVSFRFVPNEDMQRPAILLNPNPSLPDLQQHLFASSV